MVAAATTKSPSIAVRETFHIDLDGQRLEKEDCQEWCRAVTALL